jgi:O-antigen/teichoic acid export membrane protein
MSAPVMAGTPAPAQAPPWKKTFANLASVVGGETLLRAANFLVAVLVAREYGAAQFGLYATSLAYVTIAVMIADNGLQVSAITSLHEASGKIGPAVGRLYLAKTLPLLAVLAGTAAVLSLARCSALVWTVAGGLALRTVLQSYCQLQVALLKAIDRMPAIGLVQALHFAALAAGLLAVHRLRLPILNLMEVLLFCQLVEFAGSWDRLRGAGLLPGRAKLGEALQLLAASTPYGVSFTIAAFFLRLDVIVLAWIVPAREIGHFAAAQQVLVAVYLLSWLVGSVLLPELVRLAATPEALHAYTSRWVLRLLAAAVPAAILGALGGPSFMRWVYGQAFAGADRPFVILCLAIPFVLLNALYLNRAIALGARSLYLNAYAAAAVCGIAADLAFTLALGITGTALAALLREGGLFAYLHLVGNRKRSAAEA